MKLVESKKEDITIDEVIDRFDELIVASYSRVENALYILTEAITHDKTIFLGNDFKKELTIGWYGSLDEALYEWSKSKILEVQVFETYKEFIEWVGELTLDK